MSRKGLEGRQRGSILVQLGASAGVLVLPPLMLSAGVALFGSQTEDRLQVAADQTIASAVSKSSALIALSPRPREMPKSADRPPLQSEPAAAANAAPPPVARAAETVIELDEPIKETDRDAPAEPIPFLGPVPVTLVLIRKEPEPEPEAEADQPEETPEPPAPVASVAPAVIPHDAPKAPSIHPHPHKADREEAKPRRIAEKRPHAPAVAAHAPAAAHPAPAAPHRVTASAAPKAKPKSGLQHRADLEN
jgi:hypothetical protein